MYVSDNYAPEWGTSATSLVSLTGGDVVSGLVTTSTAPVWNTGLTARKTANNAVYNRVLEYAGARPTDRDSVDKRIVSHVKNRNGSIINCVASERHHALQQERRRLAVRWRRTRARLTLPSESRTARHRTATPISKTGSTLMDQTRAGRDVVFESDIAAVAVGAMSAL